jgi:hypothetical protein
MIQAPALCIECHYVEWCYAECRDLFTVILNVVMLNAVMLNVVAPQGAL